MAAHLSQAQGASQQAALLERLAALKAAQREQVLQAAQREQVLQAAQREQAPQAAQREQAPQAAQREQAPQVVPQGVAGRQPGALSLGKTAKPTGDRSAPIRLTTAA